MVNKSIRNMAKDEAVCEVSAASTGRFGYELILQEGVRF